MCAILKLRNGTEIAKIGQLKRAGITDIVKDRMFPELGSDTSCLCSVDVQATMRKAGRNVGIDMRTGDIVET